MVRDFSLCPTEIKETTERSPSEVIMSHRRFLRPYANKNLWPSVARRSEGESQMSLIDGLSAHVGRNPVSTDRCQRDRYGVLQQDGGYTFIGEKYIRNRRYAE